MENVTKKTVNDWLTKRNNQRLTDYEWKAFLVVLHNSMWDEEYGFIKQVVDEIRMARATPADRVRPVILLTEPALRYCVDVMEWKPLTAIEVDELRDYCEMEPRFWDFIEEIITLFRKVAASDCEVQPVPGHSTGHGERQLCDPIP